MQPTQTSSTLCRELNLLADFQTAPDFCNAATVVNRT